MISTEEGEFYPEKNLDKNYRIPRTSGRPNKRPMARRGGFSNQNATPLAASYYNYPYDPMAAGSYYQQGYQQFGFANSGQNPVQKGGFNFTPPPPPPPPGADAPVKSIYDTLEQIKERPKNAARNIYQNNGFGNNNQGRRGNGNQDCNYGQSQGRFGNFNGGRFGKQNNQWFNKEQFENKRFYNDNLNYQGFKRNYNQFPNNFGPNNMGEQNSFNQNFNNREKPQWPKKKKPPQAVNLSVHEVVPDLQDDTLPKDLKLLFQPLFCKLCSAQLSSNQTAKMHYKSKNHEKKIKKWLVEYAEKTGEALHPRAVAVTEKKTEDGEKNPKWFHCEVCDLQLTGQLHAESHYMGRNHQKALMGYKAPAGQGYYDNEGKWVRVKSEKAKSFNFEGGADNFGTAFRQPQEDPSVAGPPPAKKKKKEGQEPQQFHCDVCDINTTCEEQLQNHYNGQKHAKKLRLLGSTGVEQRKVVDQIVTPETAIILTQTPPPPPPPMVALPVINADDDLSVYRTPSDNFYCPTCNLTTNSKQQFVQHMNSKNHAKKVTQNAANSK